ncbi:MAG TPA: phosphoribosylformylglycinamidine synthase subunit PurQ [Actinomycetota bacterium]|nr:phosphoribosylformylglycinamidine synthase subunit PurQ [Actinomycetota bacterium]
MTVRIGVVTFPGSLDDRDALRAARFMGAESVPLWHADADLRGVDAVVLPGGFSYGDYLRTGAIARFAPVMGEVADFARRGGPVLGICNGFQILCEAGLLPGALIRNRGLSFICRWLHVRVENAVPGLPAGEVLGVPIKHGEGQFVAAPDEIERIEGEGLVALRYCSPGGEIKDDFNYNGSTAGIAGIWNEGRNVLGLMPHPEHAVDADLGATGGRAIFQWLIAAATQSAAA